MGESTDRAGETRSDDLLEDSSTMGVSEWGLEWADISLIRERLELTPTERLRASQEFINAVIRIRIQNDNRS